MAKINSGRDAILAKITAALVAPEERTPTRESEYAGIERTYRRQGTLEAKARLDLFEERLREYDGGVHRVSIADIENAAATLTAIIAEVLALRGKRRLAIPTGLPTEWLPVGFDFIEADGLSASELDSCEGVLSCCTVAIALTGSIVLQNMPGQGPRKLSLVPDYHLCIVRADQIVETVPEAMARLAPTASLPTTFISGPSATADIEMTRIKGVHGPRFLDAILIV